MEVIKSCKDRVQYLGGVFVDKVEESAAYPDSENYATV
jgi:hypothetical protein